MKASTGTMVTSWMSTGEQGRKSTRAPATSGTVHVAAAAVTHNWKIGNSRVNSGKQKKEHHRCKQQKGDLQQQGCKQQQGRQQQLSCQK
jgi:hypothetical protein